VLKILKRLIVARLWVFLLVLALIGAIALMCAHFFLDASSVSHSLVSAFAVSLLAGAILTFFLELIAVDHFREFLRGAIRAETGTLRESILGDLSARVSFLPLATYLPSDDSIKDLRKEVIRDLATSDYYFFLGATGLYAAHYTKECGQVLREVNWVLPAPNSGSVVNRARHIARSTGQSVEDVIVEIHRSMLISLSAVFSDIHLHAQSFRIFFTQMEFEDRFEITDRALYLHLFDNKAKSLKAKHPSAYRFDTESPLYGYFRRRATSIVNDCSIKLEVSSETSEEKFMHELQKIFGDEVHGVRIADLASEFQAFEAGLNGPK